MACQCISAHFCRLSLDKWTSLGRNESTKYVYNLFDANSRLEYVFVVGMILLGFLSLGGGFAKDTIVLIILRALIGIAAALTIPSSLSLIVSIFSEPRERARAIGVFGGVGAMANSRFR